MYIKIKISIILFFVASLSNQVIAAGALDVVHDEVITAAFELKGIDGKIHRLSDYQGKVVLVNFWASWCLPCIQEIPSMQALEKSLAGLPFEIVAINVAEQKRKVNYQAKRINMTFTVLLDPDSKTFKQWQAKILPTSFIVDKKGYIRYLAQGPIEWDSNEVSATIEKLLIE
ncbi:MAG: TlpA family protein disulfide reductase [Thiotrichaceae bacterium]|nr:TlpA family protein disulfide reductase [Thiotrichaceae bacterium]